MIVGEKVNMNVIKRIKWIDLKTVVVESSA